MCQEINGVNHLKLVSTLEQSLKIHAMNSFNFVYEYIDIICLYVSSMAE